MTYIIKTTISRDNLRLKEFETDNQITIQESPKQIDQREFYRVAVELLALIYSDKISSRNSQVNNTILFQ